MDAQALGVLVPILVPVAMFAMIFGIVYLYNRQKMAMIERGMDPRTSRSPVNRNYVLTWGLLLIGAGVGLFLAYILDHSVFANMNPNEDNPALYFSLIAVFGGIGLFVSYMMEKKDSKSQEN